MRKKLVFFIALFAVSAFINAASVHEWSSKSTSQEIAYNVSVAGASASAAYDPRCAGNCYALYFYCQQSCYPYGGQSCLTQCQYQFTACMQSCPN